MNLHIERPEAAVEHLRTYGYAPGGYLCRCAEENCESYDGIRQLDETPRLGTFIGDKRAWRCRPCAEKLLAESLARKSDEPVRMPQLVRDKMVPREGYNETNHQVSRPVAIALLVGKLHSEVAELSLDLTNPDEYGDVLEILMSIAKLNGVSASAIDAARQRKTEIKGGFETANFWTPEAFIND
jgi:predicted house-cleaning noncanonical NTP pyrophosphatase (MazG superfamily)